MLKNGITWVLLRFEIRLTGDMPAAGEVVTVKTWPVGVNKIFFRRDFQVSSNGNPFASAVTEWTVFDTVSRKATSIPRRMVEELTPPKADRAIENLNWKLPPLRDAAESSSFIIRKTDIDRNGHVNNVRYIEWVLEKAEGGGSLAGITVIYRAEAIYGETVTLKTFISEEKQMLQGIFNADGKELIRAKILFR
jgi:acyl-ACP thioesterase